MRRHRLPLPAALVVLALAVAAVAAGCGGSGSSTSATTTVAAAGVTTTDLLPGQSKPSVYNDPSLMVIADADVPSGFVVDPPNTRPVTNADVSTGHDDAYKRQVASWGRITGYASSWRPGSASTSGPLQIFSNASTYETVGGAQDAFAAGLKAVSKAYKVVDMKKGVGDEARMYSVTLKDPNSDTGGTNFQYAIAWRTGRVLCVVAVTAEVGALTPGDALAYAEKQQARIDGVIKAGK